MLVMHFIVISVLMCYITGLRDTTMAKVPLRCRQTLIMNLLNYGEKLSSSKKASNIGQTV